MVTYYTPAPQPLLSDEEDSETETQMDDSEDENTISNIAEEEADTASEVSGQERVDNETDRTLDRPLVGRYVKVLYDKWYMGKIIYYNKRLEEYILEFSDKTFDYVKATDINGTDMILLDK